MLLEELELLDGIEAISTFHPVNNKRITKLGGGVFLTKKAFKSSLKNKIIFFDQSMEIRRNLSKLTEGSIVEVFTRKLGAFEAYKVSVEILSSFLLGCEGRIIAINNKVNGIRERLLKTKFKRRVLFYLGEFKENKKDPDLLIVNDGFVKDLVEFGRLKTYPSSLEYVSWSQKILKTLKGSLHLSVTDGFEDHIEITSLSNEKIALKFRGALAPGIRQVYLIDSLISKLNDLGISSKTPVQLNK
jgi:hypothetical protein